MLHYAYYFWALDWFALNHCALFLESLSFYPLNFHHLLLMNLVAFDLEEFIWADCTSFQFTYFFSTSKLSIRPSPLASIPTLSIFGKSFHLLHYPFTFILCLFGTFCLSFQPIFLLTVSGRKASHRSLCGPLSHPLNFHKNTLSCFDRSTRFRILPI